MLSRREALLAGVAGIGVAALTGCAPIAARVRRRAEPQEFELPKGNSDPAVRLYARAGFGHRPGDLAAYHRDGHEATVERLLAAKAEEDPALTMQIFRMDVFRVDAMEMREIYEDEVLRQLQQAAVLRAVYGANPLYERMCDFWTNHFCIYGRKGLSAWRKGADETKVIRDHALGRFPDMLKASARSPAMLAFLDGRSNRKGTPNENYARELMELHTLGVDGGYTQRDIQEVARCFTGWRLENRFLRHHGVFWYDAERHDDGEKHILGHTIPAGGGEKDGDRVLDILAHHPSTAKFLSRKLVEQLVGARSPNLEAKVAAGYQKSKGDIRSMLRPILLSDELKTAPSMIKRPLDLVASSLRAMDATTDGNRPLLGHLAAMGQPLYEWPMPDGFPTDTITWAGPMLPRWNYAFAVSQNQIAGTSLGHEKMDVPGVFANLLGRLPRPDDHALLAAMGKHTIQEATALALASPAFQWK